MRVVLVMQQVLAVIEHELRPHARALGLTPQDLLVLGWLAEAAGISGALLADRIRRDRSNVRRALERLEQEGLTERWNHVITGKTDGWALTSEGQQRWSRLVELYQALEDEWVGTDARRLVHGLEEFMRALIRTHRNVRISGLLEVPPRPSIPKWDL